MGLARLVVMPGERGEYHLLAIDRAKLLRLVGGVAMAMWLAGGLAISAWLNRNPYNRVTMTDLLLPWRWSGLRELRAEASLAEGRDALKTGNFARGIFLVRVGLQRHPNDEPARLALGTLYARAGEWATAKRTLLPQLEWSASHGFLQTLFEQAAAFEDFETIRSVAEQRLARGELSTPERAWLAEQRLLALFRLRKLEAIAAAPELAPEATTWAARELRAVALCQLHRGAEALAYVETFPAVAAQRAKRDELLAAAYREAGRLDDMAKVLRRHVTGHPMQPEAWLFAVVQWAQAGRPDEAAAQLAGFLQRFEADDRQVQLAAWRCAAIPAPALVEACVTSARERGRPRAELMFQLALAHLRADDTAAFSRAVIRLSAEAAKLPAAARAPVFVWAETLADVLKADGTGSDGRLVELMQRGRAAMPLYRDTLAALERAGRWSAMEAIANAGLRQFSASAELAAHLSRAAEHRAAADRHDRAGAIADANDLWSRLDDCGARGDWPGADALLASVRREGAAWSASVLPELDWREARVAFERDQPARVRRLIEGRLAQRKFDVERALEFVRDYAARGENAAAKSLAEAVTRAVPESGPARRLLAELPAPRSGGLTAASAP